MPRIGSSCNSSGSGVIWEASGNWSGRGTKVRTTVFERALETAAKTIVVREKDSYLRVHGVSQDAVYNDQELQARYQTKSIINDLGKKGKFNTFSKASRRTIKELGNIELFELGEISKTVQCPTCPRYSKEGTSYCTCGLRRVLSPEKTRNIKSRFEIMSVPFCTMQEDDSRWAKHGRERWQYDHWKAKKRDKRRIQEIDGVQTNDIKHLNGITDGHKNIVDTWITLQMLI